MSLPLEDSSPIVPTDVPVYKPGNDSHSRLFGPPDEPIKIRRHQASSIVLGSEETVTQKLVAAPGKGEDTNGAEQTDSNTNGQVAESDVKGKSGFVNFTNAGDGSSSSLNQR